MANILIDRVLALMELFTLLETLVLHERCVIHSIEEDFRDALQNDPLIQPFVQYGALELLVSPDMPAYQSIRTHPNMARPMVRDVLTNIMHAVFATTAGLQYVSPPYAAWGATAEALRITRADDAETNRKVARLRGFAESLAHGQQRTDLLSRSYERLREVAVAEQNEAIAFGQTLPIPIPPIAAIVLSRASSVDGIARAALDLREELDGYRSRMQGFDRRINDPSATPKDVREAIQELKAGMETLLGTRDRDFLTATPIAESAAVAKDVVTQSPALPISLTVLGAKLLSGLGPGAWQRKRRVAFLSLIQDRFNQAAGYASAVERLFGFAVDPLIVRQLEENLARSRGGGLDEVRHQNGTSSQDSQPTD
jgi:hypothetical protein